MVDTFTVSCPDCGKSRNAKREYIGRTVECSCGARFEVADPTPSVAAEFKARNRRRWVVTVSLISAVAGSVAGLNSMLRFAGVASFTTPAVDAKAKAAAKAEPVITEQQSKPDNSEFLRLRQELELKRLENEKLKAIAEAKQEAERKAEAERVAKTLQERLAKIETEKPKVLIRQPPKPEPQQSEPSEREVITIPVAGPDDEFIPLYEFEDVRRGRWMYSIDASEMIRAGHRYTGVIGLAGRNRIAGTEELFKMNNGGYLTELPKGGRYNVSKLLGAWVWKHRRGERAPVHVVADKEYQKMRFFRRLDEAEHYKESLEQQGNTRVHLERSAFYVMP